MPRIFSGIQPTGASTWGTTSARSEATWRARIRGEAIYCIVDLHAITVSYEPEDLRRQVLDTLAMLLAAGLDPERSILFRQGDLQEHTELAWLLGGSSTTAYGDLQRMTQFKDKSSKQKELVSAGLFFYPVLQAADVLAYDADEVPVGDDQRQHIELMRDIAQRFNERFGETLVVPKHVIPEIGGRIMDLQAPENKMSTTAASELGTIYLLDDDDAIARKVKKAVADSGREVVRAPDKPGISNLIEILAVTRGVDPAQIEKEFEGKGYGDFKQAVADGVIDTIRPLRERYEEIRPDEQALAATLDEGAEKARAISGPVLGPGARADGRRAPRLTSPPHARRIARPRPGGLPGPI